MIIDPFLASVLASLASKRFLILTGLAGSGKTLLALGVASRLSPTLKVNDDPFSPGTKIGKKYKIHKSDSLSLELWNGQPDESGFQKVTLPKELIQEWVDYIKEHRIEDSFDAQQLRDSIKSLDKSKYAKQLHSFETHLKPLAFHQIAVEAKPKDTKCYELVAVGADWTGNENILGYPDGLIDNRYVTTPALDLIIQAGRNKDIPHFLILDEMNLSHVERYFSDILSSIESHEPMQLYKGNARFSDNCCKIPDEMVLPPNLFIIGTVNVDETTYQFSPKVLDRANVIEFRMSEKAMGGFLANPTKADLPKYDSKAERLMKAVVKCADKKVILPAVVKNNFESEMLLFFKVKQEHGAEFGFRVAYEASRFLSFHKAFRGTAHPHTDWFDEAFDCVILQKFLPKLHGSRAKLGPLLKKLWFLCVTAKTSRTTEPLKDANDAANNLSHETEPAPGIPADAPYPLSAEKIHRMWRFLKDNGFASFAEA